MGFLVLLKQHNAIPFGHAASTMHRRTVKGVRGRTKPGRRQSRMEAIQWRDSAVEEGWKRCSLQLRHHRAGLWWSWCRTFLSYAVWGHRALLEHSLCLQNPRGWARVDLLHVFHKQPPPPIHVRRTGLQVNSPATRIWKQERITSGFSKILNFPYMMIPGLNDQGQERVVIMNNIHFSSF